MTQSTVKQLFQITITGLLVGVLLSPVVHAQEPIGGPYEPDSATVLLMHFDGDLQNETDLTQDGETFGEISFIRDSENSVYGHQLSIDNVSSSNFSHVRIADTSGLDLKGSWTIQFWFKIDSLLYSQFDVTGFPHIIDKPGDPDESKYIYNNYSSTVHESNRNLMVTSLYLCKN